jgi:hypothetical protein
MSKIFRKKSSIGLIIGAGAITFICGLGISLCVFAIILPTFRTLKSRFYEFSFPLDGEKTPVFHRFLPLWSNLNLLSAENLA